MKITLPRDGEIADAPGNSKLLPAALMVRREGEEAVLIPLIKSGNSFLSISAREIFCLAQTAAA